MAEAKEKTVQKTYRLPARQVEFIDLMADKQIMGSTGSAVVRALLEKAMTEIIQNEFVKKNSETFELLRKSDK